jgi:hypothetical protein
MAGFGVSEWIGVGSAVVAVFSVLLNWMVVNRQTRVQAETLRASADAEMMGWANQAIDKLSEGIALARGRGSAYSEPQLRERLLETSNALSALADRGRLFFPNQEHATHGHEKESAFQGFRPVILDTVIFAHYQLDYVDPAGSEPDLGACEYLVKCRRLLVSEVQDAVDPRRRGLMMRRLSVGARSGSKTASFTAASALGEELRARYPDAKCGARGPAWIAAREKAAKG